MADDEAASGIDTVSGYLDEAGLEYEVIEHDTTYSAAAEAKADGVAPDDLAKTIVLRDARGYRLAVIPGSHRLDLSRARELLGGDTSLRLATEEEMAADFPGFDVGALPPIGPLLPATEVLDRRLLERDRIAFAAGDHRHGILLDPHDLVQLTQTKVADICES